MTRKEIFFTHLGTFLMAEGFKLKRNSFIKKVDKNVFEIDFTFWPNFSQIEPSYRILISEVEKVKKDALKKMYSKHISVGNNRYILSGKNIEECLLDTSTEELALESAKKEVIFYQEKVRRYFEENININHLDTILNSEPGSNLDIAFNSIDSSFLAIVVAYLRNRKNIAEIVPIYKSIVKKHNIDRLPKFDILAQYVLKNLR